MKIKCQAIYSAGKIYIQAAAVPFKTIHLEIYPLSLMTMALLQEFFEADF